MEREILEFTSKELLNDWFKKNYKTYTNGIWVIHGKKNNKVNLLRYDDVLELCLIYGWIDSLPKIIDENRTAHYISPRKTKSVWSKRNKGLVLSLISQNLLTDKGLKCVEQAKENDMWTIYDDLDVMPLDLINELKKDQLAYKNFNNFTPGSKRNIHLYLKLTSNAETRKKRIAKIVQEAHENKKTNN
ncbi:MAG: YdeI/OmpD-associated family protein [Patescibacteria group bacterium]